MSLVGNWQREAARFAPDAAGARAPRRRAGRGERRSPTAVRGATWCSPPTRWRPATRRRCAGIDWHRVVLDEAQAIKNAATRQAEAVRALPARHRIAVTGTPVENRLAELWSIMEFANPGLLGAAATLQASGTPCRSSGTATTRPRERLRRITGPFVLRRLKTDPSIISDLPEKLEMEVLCNLTAEQAALYQAVVDDMLARIEASDGIERRGLVLATMTKLKQVCNHPAQLLRDGSRAGRPLRQAGPAGGDPRRGARGRGEGAGVHPVRRVRRRCCARHLSARFGREVLFLHGGVGKAERDAMVRAVPVRRAGRPPLFVLSLKAGGTGLNLTAANHVVHVDRWWNPAVEDQATDRAFRIGQRRDVQVRKFVCAGTVEEKIAAMISREARAGRRRWSAPASSGSPSCPPTELRELFALERRGGGRVSSAPAVRRRTAARAGSTAGSGAQRPGRDRRVLVVPAVPRRAGVVRARHPAHPGPGVRPRRAGALARRSRPGAVTRRGAGLPRPAVPGDDRAARRSRRPAWDRVEEALAAQALFSARLLAGEMPRGAGGGLRRRRGAAVPRRASAS